MVQGLLPPPCEYPAICFQEYIIGAFRTRTDWLEQCCIRAIQVNPEPHFGIAHVAQHCVSGMRQSVVCSRVARGAPNRLQSKRHIQESNKESSKPKRRMKRLNVSVLSQCASSCDLSESVCQSATANVKSEITKMIGEGETSFTLSLN